MIDVRRLRVAIDDMYDCALKVQRERDELADACLEAIACCGPSSTWCGKTQAFLARMEQILGRSDPEGLKAALAKAEASTHCTWKEA